MASPKFNTKSPTIRRIRESFISPPLPAESQALTKLSPLGHTVREAQELSSSPSPDYTATPLETDLFEWHFTLRGPPNSPYADGIYHGRIVLPPSYPLRPPSFRFLTPSGRFEANREICLSISGHHEETWQPAWGVRTALVALRSFMETDPKGQVGGLDATDAVRRRLAAESAAWACPTCAAGRTNADVMRQCKDDYEAAAAAAATATGSGNNKEGGPGDEVVVPAELRLGFRDEMEAAAAAAAAAASKTEAGGRGGKGPAAEDAESAELAEGFVQTVVPPRAEQRPRDQQRRTPQPHAPAVAAAPRPQPTRTIPLPNPQPPVLAQAQAQAQQVHRNSSAAEAVPLWVDRAIVIIAVLLIAMLIRTFAA